MGQTGSVAFASMRWISIIGALVVFWSLLSGTAQLQNTLLIKIGAGCLALTILVSARMRIIDEESHPVWVWLRMIAYLPWILWQVVLANIDVLKRVWSPSLPIAPRFIKVPYSTRTGFTTTTYANSITLTPGTVTVTVDDDTMLIHALTAEAGDGLMTGEMEAKVKTLEGG